jgi:glyoxylase-like metal-dependent hydrolase (beta-lactamase superfamily II)
MLFRQLFESDSCTYTYLLACQEHAEAVLIDPVLETMDRDLQVLQDMGLHLTMTLETHVHADHLTSARKLRHVCGSRVAYPAMDELPCADVGLREGEPLRVGSIEIHPLHTPGHTAHHHAYLLDNGPQQLLFTGDALLIDACGRTDFQSGDPAALYRSVQGKLFPLPGETLVYPGHDYDGRFVSTIAQERARNPRLRDGTTQEQFVSIMNGLDLPYPRKIDFAVPGNELCGECPPNVPEEYRGPCALHEQG